MDDTDSRPNKPESKLADFYYIAEDYGQVEERELRFCLMNRID